MVVVIFQSLVYVKMHVQVRKFVSLLLLNKRNKFISLTTVLLQRNFHVDEEKYEFVCSMARARSLTEGKMRAVRFEWKKNWASVVSRSSILQKLTKKFHIRILTQEERRGMEWRGRFLCTDSDMKLYFC